MQDKQSIESQDNKKSNNAGAAVVNIISWVVTVIAVLMMVFTIISSLTFNRNDRNFLGFKFYIVQSDSMSATDFNAGDLIVSKKVDPTTLKEGDIISFQSQNTENYGETITHKIRRATVDNEGNPGFITYGTTTNTDDEAIVTYPFIMGKYTFKIPKMGYFFTFVKSVPGYILCILVPFVIIILIQGIRTIKYFKKYKSEQKTAIEKEREEITKQREENEKMMRELLEMKEQMMNPKRRESDTRFSGQTLQPVRGVVEEPQQRPTEQSVSRNDQIQMISLPKRSANQQRSVSAQRTSNAPRTQRHPRYANLMQTSEIVNTQRKPENTDNQE